MKLEKDLVTVLMNSYREDKYRFMRAVQSVLSNTGTNVQLVLSTVAGDPCIKWIKRFNGNICVVVNEKPGIYQQINNALPMIKGMYMCYASSNDIMMPHKLKMERDLLVKSGKRVCYSSHIITKINGTKKEKTFFDYDYKEHLVRNFVSDCAMVYTPMLLCHAPFRTEFKNHAYHYLWLSIYREHGDVFLYNPTPTWIYIVTSDSQSYKRRLNFNKKLKNEHDRQLMLQSFLSEETESVKVQ